MPGREIPVLVKSWAVSINFRGLFSLVLRDCEFRWKLQLRFWVRRRRNDMRRVFMIADTLPDHPRIEFEYRV